MLEEGEPRPARLIWKDTRSGDGVQFAQRQVRSLFASSKHGPRNETTGNASTTFSRQLLPCSACTRRQSMGMNSKTLSSALFYRFTAVCCVYYVAAQLLQDIVFHLGINDSASGEAEIVQRLTFLDQFRAVALLLGFSLIPILAAYAGVASRRYSLRPAASLLGFAFSVLFVGSEAGVRSIDLFLVSKKWAATYQASSDATIRAAIAGQIQTWDEAVGAFYYALLAAHLLSTLCFAIATWDRKSFWDRAVAIGFAATAVECTARLAEGYLGQMWLSGLNGAAYFPVVVLNFGTMAVWLWRQAGTTSTSPPSAPSAL